MAGIYTYLDLRGVVWRRTVDGLTSFQEQLDNRQAQHVLAVRVPFSVEFSEFSPQVAGPILESILTTVKIKDTAEVILVEKDFT